MLRRLIAACAVALVTASPLRAQDRPAGTDATPMTAHGTVDVGYRTQDLSGNADTFRQLFDLTDGPRLFGAEFRATGGSASGRPFDSLTFNTNGIGGDPFPSVQLRARRSRVYDVRLSWRRLRLFNVAPQTPDMIDGFDTRAVTDRHSWSTSRQLGNVSAAITATPQLQILLGYDRVSRNGAIGSTRSVDFIGSSTAWGGFARANPYPVSGPVNDVSNRVTGGLSYSWKRATIHYRVGYQTSDQTLSLDPLAAPERSINVGDAATANELLSSVGWAQHQRLTIPSSELSFVAQPAAAIEWRGEYLYFRARGPFSLDAAFSGSARTAAAAVTSPYQVRITAEGEGQTPNHIIGQGFTYRPSEHWGVNVDYRRSHLESESTGNLTSVLADYDGAVTPITTRESDVLAWADDQHIVRAAAFLQPVAGLTVRPGLRFSRREIIMTDDGIVDPATTRTFNTVTPELSIGYHPRSWVDVHGVIRYASNDAAYTRMTPSDRHITRVVVTLQPTDALTVTAAADQNIARLATANFESRIRGASAHASYSLSDRVSAFGSFDYRRLLAIGDTTFLRGTAPIANLVMQDNETDYIWQGGATVRLAAGLDVTATGIYDRTTGTDEITGEPPLYGPVSLPFGTMSVSYAFPRLGKMSIDFQRAHMSQELLPLNDFQATIVTIRLTRSF